MLKIIITDLNGGTHALSGVVSVVLNSSLSVPADDITVTLAYDESIIGNADFISAYSGDELVFEGQTDEIICLCSGKKSVIKITARSRAGMLLDNEAEPVCYYRPSADYIFKRHAEPYGISAVITENKLYGGTFSIEKGTSQWQVLENFCKSCYGAAPRITGDGRALLSADEYTGSAVFGTGAVPYRSIRRRLKRCELISKVNVKTDSSGSYSSWVKNTLPECSGIVRERYVNASADNASLGTADAVISAGNSAYEVIELECPGCFTDLVGKSASVADSPLGSFDGLVVRELSYSLGADEEITTVTLGGED